ncbi:unnamed protein product [Ceutorhynchus assimilis]|uniref:Cathepsin propeptide inhibitor domain-containing protein n=1 Tax=Ceutorhynchus assimilis TaxID=467358 RepID=A0A9N9MJ31_9CUCU|nr:unnamed protein product [Ceutorhynchus assimilis]
MSLTDAELALDSVDINERWNNFKEKHSRNFETPEEEAKRFQIFQDTLKEVQEHNAKFKAGQESYSKALNSFADRTPDELPKRGLMCKR